MKPKSIHPSIPILLTFKLHHHRSKSQKTIIDGLYSSKKGEWTPLTLEWVQSGKNKYFYDWNNWDKWEIIGRFWYPITHLIVSNLDQCQNYLRILELNTWDMWGEQSDKQNNYPMSAKYFSSEYYS